MAGPATNTLVFCCWNEFGEGHYIEPTRGYGFDYLDVIRDTFTGAKGPHTDIGPEDLDRPCDSWYLEARKATPKLAPDTAAWAGATLTAWRTMMGLGELGLREGVLCGISDNGDPAWSLPDTRIRAGRYTRAVVEIRLSKPGVAQLFWTTATEPGTSEAASVTAPVPGDGQFHRCVLEVGRNEHWSGAITSLRFDPTMEKGVRIEIRSIGLE